MSFTTKGLLRSILVAAAVTVLIFPDQTAQKRLCGRALTNALKVICDSNYNSMDKKSVMNNIDLDELYDQSYFDEDYAYRFAMPPFLNKLGGGVIIPKVRRLRHGVSDECCKKSCSYSELTSYCRHPTK